MGIDGSTVSVAERTSLVKVSLMINFLGEIWKETDYIESLAAEHTLDLFPTVTRPVALGLIRLISTLT